MKSPPVINCHKRTSVSENGTMKAGAGVAPGDFPQRQAGEDAEPERRVAAEGIVHLLFYRPSSSGAQRVIQ